jgi:hypothetical protein
MDTTCTTVPGRLIQLLNPTLSVRIPEKPTYLFESSELRAYGASLLERFSAQDLRQNIPVVKRTDNFPYRFQGTLMVSVAWFRSTLCRKSLFLVQTRYKWPSSRPRARKSVLSLVTALPL